MNTDRESHSLTGFQLHTPEFVQHLKESGEPLVLTIDGVAALVVQDAASYQNLLDLAETSRVVEGIRLGLADMKAGRTEPNRSKRHWPKSAAICNSRNGHSGLLLVVKREFDGCHGL